MKKYCTLLLLSGAMTFAMSCQESATEKTGHDTMGDTTAAASSTAFDIGTARTWIDNDNAKFMEEAKKGNQPQQDNSGDMGFNKGEDKVGRAYHKDDTYDISHVDRQEGAMHHGVLGGNFECEEDNDSKSADKNDNNK